MNQSELIHCYNLSLLEKVGRHFELQHRSQDLIGSLLTHHAFNFWAKTLSSPATQLNQRKLSLPHHLGQKFQVLWALR
jgi:hypothetical protein